MAPPQPMPTYSSVSPRDAAETGVLPEGATGSFLLLTIQGQVRPDQAQLGDRGGLAQGKEFYRHFS